VSLLQVPQMSGFQHGWSPAGETSNNVIFGQCEQSALSAQQYAVTSTRTALDCIDEQFLTLFKMTRIFYFNLSVGLAYLKSKSNFENLQTSPKTNFAAPS